MASPSTTISTTTATLTTTRVLVLLMPCTSNGATRTPMIAPTSTPTNDSSATAMPWRHPETAAINARTTTTRSTQLTPPLLSWPRDLLPTRSSHGPCVLKIKDPRGVPRARPPAPIQQRGQ